MSKPPLANTSRLTDIANAIRSLAQQVMQPAQDVADAAAALDEQRAGVTSLREELMLQVASKSAAEGWTKGEIDAAAKQAATNANRPKDEKPTQGEKTMGVFISDLRQVANPKVCARFAALLAMRDDAWAIEDDAYASAPTKEEKALIARPCRKLWGRRYHMLMALVRDTIDDKVVITSTSDIITYAVTNDPDLDPNKVRARLEAIVTKLMDIHADFQHDDIKTCIDFLNVIDVQTLIAVKVKQSLTTVENVETHVPPVLTQVQTPAAAPIVSAYDDIDAMLTKAA